MNSQPSQSNSIVSVHTIAMDAHIIKGRLEAEGIPAYLTDDQYITMDWMFSQALGGVKVRVPYVYRERAIAVLNNNQSGDFDLSKATDLDLPEFEQELLEDSKIHCPECNSIQVGPFDWFWKLSLLVLFTYHTPIAFSKQYYKCRKCMHMFRLKKSRHSKLLRVTAVLASVLLAMIVIFSMFAVGRTTYHYTDAEPVFLSIDEEVEDPNWLNEPLEE